MHNTNTSTAERLSGVEYKPRKKRECYSTLVTWPSLAPAVAVHLNVNDRFHRNVPVKLMRKVGLRPELGVHVVVKNNRALLWQDERVPGPFKQDAETKVFHLPSAGLGAKLAKARFAIVEGPDYLIVTTQTEALALGGDAAVSEYSRWERLNEKSVQRLDEDLLPDGLQVVEWQDFSLFHTNVRAKTGVASVAGRLWWMAGFVGGDSLRFTRYKNATVIEKGDPAHQHSALAQGSNGSPRHYIGASLFDFHKSDTVRVLATPGRLIVTLPDSSIGQLGGDVPRKAHCSKQVLAPAYQPEPPAAILKPSDLTVLAKRDYRKDSTTLPISGRLWNVAGFERLQPARMVSYGNAVAIEPCSESDMDFRIGNPSQRSLQRNVSLAHTTLARESRIRVLVCEGRIVLTARNGDLGRKFRAAAEWPNKPADVTEFIDNLRRPPAVEVSEYNRPAGRRLQIQGKWLGDFGFTPGAKYEVAADKQGVSLRLVSDGGSTVTHLNPGSETGKLYVPAQSLAKLKSEKVRVLGRAGELRILPLAA